MVVDTKRIIGKNSGLRRRRGTKNNNFFLLGSVIPF
jgi:hypothetical protein